MATEQQIFISSPFRDFPPERDYFSQYTFPGLAARLREAHIPLNLMALDLRVGVTIPNEEEWAKTVVQVCFEGIQQAKPFLLVFLGERYGSIPPVEHVQWVTQETSLAPDKVQDKSVTALEIEYGAFAGVTPHVRFYFRDGIDGVGIPAEFFEPDPNNRAKQAALKQRIAAQFPQAHIHHYRLCWDGSRIDQVGLAELSDKVAADLWAMLQETGQLNPPEQGEYQLATAALKAFIAHRQRGFQGREDTLKQLAAHLQAATAPPILALTGPGGSGKSAVFAELYARLLSPPKPPLVLAWAAGASAGLGDVSAILRYWLQVLYTHWGEAVPDNLRTLERQVLEQQFQQQVSRACANQLVVLLFDALDQAAPEVQSLNWLPKPWPAGLRMVVTVLEGQAQAGLKVHAANWQELLPLDQVTAEAALAGQFARYGRYIKGGVPAPITQAILTHGQAAWGNPLWLALAGDALNQISGPQLAHIEATHPAGQAMGTAIVNFLTQRAQSFAPTVPKLFSDQLAMLETLHDPQLLAAYAGLIATSRNGLRDMDLLACLPKLLNRIPTVLELTTVRHGFRGQIVKREAGQWDFFHRQIREGVTARYLLAVSTTQTYHRVLGQHLRQLPNDDALASAWPLHLALGRDAEGLIAGLQGSEEILQAAAPLLAEALHLDPNPTELLQWYIDLLAAADATQRHDILWGIIYLNRHLAKERQLLSARQTLLLGLHQTLTPQYQARQIAPDYATLLSELGDLYREDLKDPAQAQGYYAQYLKLTADLHQRFPADAGLARDYGVALERMGVLYREDLKDPAQAQGYYAEMLKLYADLHQRFPEDAGFAQTYGIGLGHMGDLYRQDLKDPAQAQGYYAEMLKLYADLHQRFPADAGLARDYGIALGRMGDLYREDLKDPAQAQGYFAQKLKLNADLHQRFSEDAGLARDYGVALERMGDLYREDLKDPAQAQGYFAQDLKLSADLHQRFPEDAGFAQDYGVALERMGDLYREDLKDPAQAQIYYTQMLKLYADLHQRFPADAGLAREYGGALGRMGDLYREDLKDPAQAQIYFAQYLQLSADLHQRFPDDAGFAQGYGVALGRMGDLYREDLKDPAQAQIYFAQYLKLTAELHQRFPDDAGLAQNYGVALERMGNLYREDLKDPAQAQIYFAQFLKLTADLHQRYPDDAGLAQNYGVALERMGDLYREDLNDPAQAREHFATMLKIGQQFYQRHPQDHGSAEFYATALQKLSEVEHALGNLQSAKQYYQQGSTVFSNFAQYNISFPDYDSIHQKIIAGIAQVQQDLSQHNDHGENTPPEPEATPAAIVPKIPTVVENKTDTFTPSATTMPQRELTPEILTAHRAKYTAITLITILWLVIISGLVAFYFPNKATQPATNVQPINTPAVEPPATAIPTFTKAAMCQAAVRLLQNQGMTINATHLNTEAATSTQEVDVLLETPSNLVAIDCRATWDIWSVSDYTRRIAKLKQHPQYALIPINGVIVGMEIPPPVAEYAMQKRLYVISPDAVGLAIRNPSGFVPQAW